MLASVQRTSLLTLAAFVCCVLAGSNAAHISCAQSAPDSGPILERPAQVDERDATRGVSLAAEQENLRALDAQLEAAQQRISALQQQKQADGKTAPDAVSADVTAALNQANVLKTTAQAAQRELDEIKQRVRAEGPQPEVGSDKPGNWLADNPFTPEKLIEWGLYHGPRLATILVAAFLLYLLVKLSGRHLAKIVAHGASRGTQRERDNRAITLVGVFQNVATLAVLGGGSLMLLDEVGIPILPLMGGAAVLGLAVAFGSQNLIKDYFSGFMVLMEDQYGVNDVVKIGDISGAVEQITLRVTVLRDLEGVVHFVPHGTITTVSNMTHGWSRALLDIGVGYREDTDRVMATMLDVASALRADADFGPFILEDAEMLGVDLLGDSSVSVKMVIKTHPLKRWAVKREYLRRIKQRFDQLGIEIPFPYRNVLVRQIGNPDESAPDVA